MNVHSVMRILGALFLVACATSQPAPPAATRPTDVLVRTVGITESFSPKGDSASLNAFVPAVAPVDSGGECSITRTSGSGATHVTAGYPMLRDAHTTIVMMFDSVGHLIRYSERRGGQRIPSTVGMNEAQRDSTFRAALNAIRATTISLDYAMDQAFATNRGGGLGSEGIMGSVRSIERLEKLGPPQARLARARRLCGV